MQEHHFSALLVSQALTEKHGQGEKDESNLATTGRCDLAEQDAETSSSNSLLVLLHGLERGLGDIVSGEHR